MKTNPKTDRKPGRAGQAVQPYCPECGLALVRTFSTDNLSDVADAWIRVRCGCGWKGRAKWFVTQA